MNTLESFLAPARVSDWMACAHVRRCPNWQCWWDEDSVVAASGLTEDDERNLQADKMRSKARARKLAKSKCSFPLSLSFALSRRLGKLLRLYMSLSFVISLKRGGGHSLSRVNSSAKNVSRSGLLARGSPHVSGLASLVPGVTTLRVWWETVLVFGLISLQLQTQPSKKRRRKKRKRKNNPSSVLKLTDNFFGVRGRHGARLGSSKATRKVVETESNFL